MTDSELIADFGGIVEYVKNSDRGTLILIDGLTGCGKTTLAMKLLKELNGSEDILCVYTQKDVDYLKNNVPKDRAFLIDDLVDSFRILSEAYVLTDLGYIPIVITSNLRYMPRRYWGGRDSEVLAISFFKRGAFHVTYRSIDIDEQISQEDVGEAKAMVDSLIDRRLERLRI